MSFRSPETTPPAEVDIRVQERVDGGDRLVSVACAHHNLVLGCTHPQEVTLSEHVREALCAHVHHAGCRCSQSIWSVWHVGLPWPEARHQPCLPDRN